jgi:hypothetical protein
MIRIPSLLLVFGLMNADAGVFRMEFEQYDGLRMQLIKSGRGREFEKIKKDLDGRMDNVGAAFRS